MFGKKIVKPVRPVIRIEAELTDGDRRRYVKTIDIPNGCTVSKADYSSDLIIRDADGNTKTTINFQAGFTVVVNYIY